MKKISVQEICPYTNHVIARFTIESGQIVFPQPCTKHHMPSPWYSESAADYIERVKPYQDAITIAHRTTFIYEDE